MKDILIIGGGAAGLSAAITAKARNKDVLVIGNPVETSSIYKAEKIDNYPGLYGLTGREFLQKFIEHADRAGVQRIEGKVLQIFSMGSHFSVTVGDSIYEGKTVIIATGIKKGASIKGEAEFLGKGLSYCATCDGMLYKNKTVVITGAGEEIDHDTKFLMDICEKVIYVSGKTRDYEGDEKVEVRKGKVTDIIGDTVVSAVVINGEKVDCDGIFVINESIPADSLIYGIEIKDGAISTNKNAQTNIPGIFAAGDCTGKPFQISKAVGEGLVAALSAAAYIDQH